MLTMKQAGQTIEDSEIFAAKELIMKLTEENCNLKRKVTELQNRLRWISSLTKGLIENDLLRKIREGGEENEI